MAYLLFPEALLPWSHLQRLSSSELSVLLSGVYFMRSRIIVSQQRDSWSFMENTRQKAAHVITQPGRRRSIIFFLQFWMLPINPAYDRTFMVLNAGTCSFCLYFPLLAALRSTPKNGSIAQILLHGCYLGVRTSKDIHSNRYAFSKTLGVSLVATSAIVDRFSFVLYPHHDLNSKGKQII